MGDKNLCDQRGKRINSSERTRDYNYVSEDMSNPQETIKLISHTVLKQPRTTNSQRERFTRYKINGSKEVPVLEKKNY